MKRKLWSVLLAVALLIGVMPTQVFALVDETKVSIVSATDAGGNAVTATYTNSGSGQLFYTMSDKFFEMTDAERAQTAKYFYLEDTSLLCADPIACGTLDLTGTGASETNPVSVTFSLTEEWSTMTVNCTTAGHPSYYILQESGGSYKLIHATAAKDGELTAAFTEAGRFNILIDGYDLMRASMDYYNSSDVVNTAAVSSATDGQGNPVNVTVTELSVDHIAVAVDYGVYELCDQTEDMKFFAAGDLSADGAEGPVTVVFTAPGVKAGDKVCAIHFNTANEKWERLEGTAGDGTVTVTFASLSPVALATVTDRQAVTPAPTPAPAQTPSQTQTPSQASVQTGQTSNKAETTTTTVNGSAVTQKEMTQSDLNDVQKNILGTYFTAMQNIEQDAMLSAEQKQNKKAENVQAWINSALGVNYRYKKGVYAVYDIKASDLSQPIPITVDGVKAGDQAVIAHLKADGTWEKVAATEVGNGVVYAKFDSLSPVFVAVLQNSNSTVSPKTADANPGMFFVIAAVAALGIAVAGNGRAKARR